MIHEAPNHRRPWVRGRKNVAIPKAPVPAHLFIGRPGNCGAAFVNAGIEDVQQFRGRCRDVRFETRLQLKNTRKLLERILLDDAHRNYKPHEKSMPLDRLATHVAEIPAWMKMALDSEVLDTRNCGPIQCFRPHR
jgi:hypothetical protein